MILRSAYNSKADIWSLGITAYEMAMGLPPHSNIHPMRVLFLIPRDEPPNLPSDRFSENFRDFIARCLVKKPSQRPQADELLNHPFIQSAGPIEELIPLIEKYQKWSEKNTPCRPWDLPNIPGDSPEKKGILRKNDQGRRQLGRG